MASALWLTNGNNKPNNDPQLNSLNRLNKKITFILIPNLI